MDDERIAEQRHRHEATYSDGSRERWEFHYTQDPLVRYLRDRRLRIGLGHILTILGQDLRDILEWRALVVCGGVGGEGTFLANLGFRDVTVSDFSEKSLDLCRTFDDRLKTLALNAEDLALEADTYDLVVVQDGIHHLSRPALGFTEMLRVSRRAVLIIEPHVGQVARVFGQTWERSHGATNYVFRWNQNLLEQTTRSYLLSETTYVKALRVWDHNLKVGRVARRGPEGLRVAFAKSIYRTLGSLLPGAGNNMVGVVIKDDRPTPERLVSH